MAETKRTSQKSKSSTAAKAAQQQSSGKASKKTPTVADQVVVQSARGGTWISTRAILAVVVLALFVQCIPVWAETETVIELMEPLPFPTEAAIRATRRLKSWR